jgi:hypothetical protein
MRVIAPFFAVLASITTMGAAVVRLWWSKPRFKSEVQINDQGRMTSQNMVRQDPKAKPWLQTAAKWWLIVVVLGGTAIFFIWVIFTLISLSN